MATQETRGGLTTGFIAGESGWGDSMNDNLVRLSHLALGGGVKSRLSTPPTTPAEGDAYIVGQAATGEWAGREDEIAVWPGAWIYYTPPTGFITFVDDEDKIVVYKNGWSVGISI